MRRRLFGLEAELAVSATRDAAAVPPIHLVGTLAKVAQRTLEHLPGGNGRLYLSNGGLFYVDCGAHPEVATPECTTPTEAVCHLRAGERMVERLARLAGEELKVDEVLVSRTNVDYHNGTTWGCHESYLGARPIGEYKDWLIPHLASRIVFTGSGGIDPLSPGIRLSLSPRVAHINHVVSTESTTNRGIFHTRDESLCTGYSRIHVLAGDNACSERSTWLKVGTTALVVALAEACAAETERIRLVDPVGAMQGFARDLRYQAQVKIKRAKPSLMTATEIQRYLLARVQARAGETAFPDWAPAVCAAWKDALDLIDSPAIHASHAFDWPLKFALLRREIARSGFTEPMIAAWSNALERLLKRRPADCGHIVPVQLDHARIVSLRAKGVLAQDEVDEAEGILRAQGLSWDSLGDFNRLRRHLCATDIRFAELGGGIFELLDQKGLIRDHRMVTHAQISAAASHAPTGTRAAVRGYWIQRLARRRRRYECGWSGIAGKLMRLDLSDPFAVEAVWKKTLIRRQEEGGGGIRFRILAGLGVQSPRGEAE